MSSLIDVKNELSSQVHALNDRMNHIDEQINRIVQILSPVQMGSNQIPPSQTTEVLKPFSPSSLRTLVPSTISPSAQDPPLSPEGPPIYMDASEIGGQSDMNQSSSTISDLHPSSSQLSERSAPSVFSRAGRQGSIDSDLTPLSIPPPPSVYNRTSPSSMMALGLAAVPPRGSTSNRIAPAPLSSSSSRSNSQSEPSASFRPISKIKSTAGRSPKPKLRSQTRAQSRTIDEQQASSTVIDLESEYQLESSNRTASLLSSSRPASNVFRRFMTSGSQSTEKKTTPSSTLLYPPNSDEERPSSPFSSGNDDDDHRPLTSSSSKYRHQTPL